ncbi:ABC transporter ATP-binding protein [Methylocystis sp. IM3]|uniref:ABC transporter ATP-binding protein n=1 Tax=unclassified Methylocystis TaxID=2625913 RepID=UPI0030FBF631
MSPTDAPRQTTKLGAYRRAFAYFAPDWPWIATLVALIGVSVGVGLLEAWPLAILVDTVLAEDPKRGWLHGYFLAVLPKDRIGQLFGLVVIGLALQVVGYSAWMGRMMINYYLNYWGTTRVRADLFGKLQRLDLGYHQTRPQGDSIYRLTTDAFGPWGIVDIIIGTSVAAVTLTVMTTILLSRSPPLTFAAYSVAPLILWSNWRFGMKIHKRALESKQVDADLTAHIQQAITRVPLAQAFRREPSEFERFEQAVARSVKALLRLNWQEQLYPLARDLILSLGSAIILGYGGWLVYRDQFLAPVAGGMTVGALMIFMDYLRKLWDPLKWLAEFFSKVRTFEAAARRVFFVLDTPEAIRDRPDAAPLPPKPRLLTLDHVTFGYLPGRVVLDDVTATIAPGEMAAFVGPSGTGKSSLLKLMLRFHDPLGGALRLDGQDIRDVKLADLRAHFAFVTQENLMLPASVAENIAYGRPAASRGDIERAAALAGAAAFIDAMPQGYDAILSEGGANLSGGQRQRLAIARALLSEAPFLALDEPTSALDPQNEMMLVGTLHRLKRRRTILLVTHRLNSVVDCDRVFVMDAGRIVERGTHAELLARNGVYACLWRQESSETAPEPQRPFAVAAAPGRKAKKRVIEQ